MPEDNTRPSKIRVCIVGAGIVGLAGALFFQRYGFNVEVLERDTCLRVVGAHLHRVQKTSVAIRPGRQ